MNTLSKKEVQKILSTPTTKIERPKNVIFHWEMTEKERKHHARKIMEIWKKNKKLKK